MHDRLTYREVQELLYNLLITAVPVDSAHGPDWHEADCECDWRTSGSERVCSDAAYDHIAEVHMLGWEALVFAVGDRLRDALGVMPYNVGMVCNGGHECACGWEAIDRADDLIDAHTKPEKDAP